MAELIADLKINTNAFTQGVQKAVDDVKKLSTGIENIKGFDEASKSAKLLGEDLRKALAVMVLEGKEGTAEFKRLSQQFKDTNAESVKLATALKKVDAQLDDIGKSANKAGSKAKEGLGSFGDALTGGLVGGGVAVLGSQLASLASTAFTAVIEKGSQFEQTLSAVGAIVGQSGDKLNALGDSARQLAVKFGTEATDQLSAFQTILSKVGPQVGENAQALGKFTDAANTLAKAGGIDAATATNNLVDSMLQLGLVTGDSNKDAENAVFLTNQLAKSAQVGAAEIPQVAQSLLQVGASSKLLNQSTDATIAAIQALALGGKTGSEAGVAYRNVLGLMVKSSGEGDKAFARLGTSTKELGKLLTDAKSPTEALRKLKTGLASVSSESERAALLSKIFGAENSAAASILIENVDKISEFQTGIQDAQKGTGSAFEQAKQQMETFQQVAKSAQATLSDIAISAFQEFQKVLGSLFSGNSIDFGEIASKAKQVIGIIGEVLRPVLQYGILLSNIFLAPIKIIISAFSSIKGVFEEVFGGGRESTVSFGEAIQSVFSAVGSIFDLAVEGIKVGIDLLVTIFGAAFKPLLAPFQETGKETQTLAERIKSFADGVKTTFDNVKNVYIQFANSVRENFDKISTIFKTFYNVVFNTFVAIGTVIQGVINIFLKIFNEIKNGVASVLSPLNNLIATISKWTSGLFATEQQTKKTNQVVAKSPGFFDKLGQAVSVAGGILNFFQASLEATGAFFDTFAKTVAQGFELLSQGNFSGAFDTFKNSVSASLNAFDSAYNKSVANSKLADEQRVKSAEKTQKTLQKATEGNFTKEEQQRQIDEANGKKTQDNKNKNVKSGTKTVESELKKQQKLYEEQNGKLTNTASEYYKAIQALQSNETLTESQKANQRLKLDQDLNNKRKELLRSIFQLEGDNINNLSTKIKLTKEDDFKTVKDYYEKELIEADKLNTEATKIKADRLTREQELNKKFFETFVSDTKDAFGNANELLNLKIDEAITSTALIEQLKALGIEVEFGAKLNKEQIDNIGKLTKDQLQTILSDIGLAQELVKDDPKQAKALQEFRFKVEDALKGIKTEVKVEPKTLAGSLLDSLGGLANSLSKVDFKIDVSETTKALQEVAKQIEEVDKALAKGEITGEEYQKRIAEIKKTEEETLKGTSSLLGQLGKSAIPAFTELANNSKSKLNSINEQFRTNEKFVMNWGEVTANAVGFAAGSFAKYREETDSTLKAVVLSAIDTLNALVPILTAQIFGLYASSPNPANIGTFGAIGIAAAGVVTSALLALVKSAVAGFETGGLVKGGEQMIRINELGQEYVVNANATRRNQALLEHLNSGNDRKAYELLHQRYGASQTMVNGSGQLVSISELQAIKTELQMLRSERTLSTSKVQLESTSMEIDGNKMVAVINSVNRNKSKLR